MMRHDTPKSSMTTHIAYNPEAKVLILHVRKGSPIHLANVPEEHFHGIKAADSAGKYYHAHLKDKFSPAK